MGSRLLVESPTSMTFFASWILLTVNRPTGTGPNATPNRMSTLPNCSLRFAAEVLDIASIRDIAAYASGRVGLVTDLPDRVRT